MIITLHSLSLNALNLKGVEIFPPKIDLVCVFKTPAATEVRTSWSIYPAYTSTPMVFDLTNSRLLWNGSNGALEAEVSLMNGTNALSLSRQCVHKEALHIKPNSNIMSANLVCENWAITVWFSKLTD